MNKIKKTLKRRVLERVNSACVSTQTQSPEAVSDQLMVKSNGTITLKKAKYETSTQVAPTRMQNTDNSCN